MILRTSSKGNATATPDRTTSGTRTRAAGTLLTPRTLATTGDIGTAFLLLAALTTTSHVGNYSLVHEGLVELATKGAIGDFDGLSAINIQLHVNSPLTASLDGRTHENVATGRTGHCALDQQEVALGIDTHDFQGLHGYALGAHVPGHLFALEYTTRSLALTDGSRDAVGYGVTVGIVLTTEIPALDGTGKAFTLGLTGDIHQLSCLKDFRLDFVTSLVFAVFQTKLQNGATCSNIRLSEVTGLRFGHTGSTTLTNGNLHRTVAIAFFVLELGDAIRLDLDDRNRNRDTFFGEDAGHAALTTDYTNSHFKTS